MEEMRRLAGGQLAEILGPESEVQGLDEPAVHGMPKLQRVAVRGVGREVAEMPRRDAGEGRNLLGKGGAGRLVVRNLSRQPAAKIQPGLRGVARIALFFVRMAAGQLWVHGGGRWRDGEGKRNPAAGRR